MHDSKLILLLGPAGSGKTRTVTQAFEDALKHSTHPFREDLLFILPTAEHRERVVDLLLRRELPGFFGRRVSTFDRTLKSFLKLGGIDFASDVARRMMLKEILLQTKFQYFDEAARTSGFLELLSKAIIELKEYLIRPDELKRKLAVLGKRFPEFELKYREFLGIYEAYERELEKRGLVDARDSLRLLEEGLKHGEYAKPELKGVWIDGFSDFSKLQLAFIEFLARHSDQVTVTLTTERNTSRTSLFETVSSAQSELESIGFKPVWAGDENHRTQAKSLVHLERNLFQSAAAAKIEPDGAVQIFEAAGLLGEVEMMARQIKRLNLKSGYHFSDIALILRQTDPYVSVIRSVFGRFGIPVEFHERFRLGTNAVARTVMSLLAVFLEGWKREDLFNFLKSSYVKSTSEGLPKFLEAVCDMELRAFRKGIFKGREYWLRSFRLPLLGRMAEAEDRLRAVTSVREFVRLAAAVLKQFGLLDFRDTDDERTRTDREAARRILLLLDELARKSSSRAPRDGARRSGDEEITSVPAAERPVPRNDDLFQFLAEELLTLIEVDLFSVHARDKNRVQVYNVSLARQKEYKAVFLAGLLERKFPLQIREDPVFSDAERRVLNERGTILKERLPRQSFERYLFYMGATRPRERLILSYPRFDLEGKQALPSFYVDEVRMLFRGPVVTKRQSITEVLPDWDDVSTEEEAEGRVIKEICSAPETSRNVRDEKRSVALCNVLLGRPGFQSLLRRLLVPIQDAIRDEKVKARFQPKDGCWSPTLLEEYAECPYRYFAHRMLGLESQTEGIDICRKGIILHEVLEQFFSSFRGEQLKKASFEDAKTFCLNYFNELWEKEPLSGDRWYRIELERRRMEEMIVQVLRAELVDETPPLPGLEPRYFEYAFGFGETKGDQLRLRGRKKTILLRGKIDRIDVDPKGKYALVIDYKTGKKFRLGALENGTALQLPLYLAAVKEKLGLEPLGGHLYSLAAGKSTGFHHQKHLDAAGISTSKWNRLSGEQFEAVMERAVHFAERFSEEIEQANIAVKPRDCVSYCPYSGICRIEKWRLPHVYRRIAEEDRQYFKEAKFLSQ